MYCLIRVVNYLFSFAVELFDLMKYCMRIMQTKRMRKEFVS
jgi:hypothetical protein